MCVLHTTCIIGGVRYTIDFSTGAATSDVTVTVTGKVSFAGIESWRGALLGDTRFRPNLRVLVEYTDVELTNLPTSAAHAAGSRFFDHLERIGSAARWAIVAEQDAVFGCVRTAAAAFENECARRHLERPPIAIAILRRRPDAITWLNSDMNPPALEPAYQINVPPRTPAGD